MLEAQIEWWIWIVAGVILLAMEMLVPIMVALWFGAAAILLGVFVWVYPIHAITQIAAFTFFGVFMTGCWFRFFKPGKLNKTGQSESDIIGQIGLVVKGTGQYKGHGELRLQKPILGSESWPFLSSDEINEGDRVEITSISGNTLTVKKT